MSNEEKCTIAWAYNIENVEDAPNFEVFFKTCIFMGVAENINLPEIFPDLYAKYMKEAEQFPLITSLMEFKHSLKHKNM